MLIDRELDSREVPNMLLAICLHYSGHWEMIIMGWENLDDKAVNM